MVKSIRRKLIVGGLEHVVGLRGSIGERSLVVEFDGIPFEIFLGDQGARDRLVIIDGLPVPVLAEYSRRGNHILRVNNKRIQVSLTHLRDAGLPHPDAGISRVFRARSSVEQEGRVTAHMPGRIISVEVRPLQKVEVGDPMFVLVAMKMENTLVAPIRGIVREVRVQVGSSVNKGDLLARIE